MLAQNDRQVPELVAVKPGFQSSTAWLALLISKYGCILMLVLYFPNSSASLLTSSLSVLTGLLARSLLP